ncbi:MAG TPA: flagellar hook assembly protein FlgD [Polyangiaceae bacterium]|nr:flagellar hook assembly protein FlgD [Polyangiaceae bacterium]
MNGINTNGSGVAGTTTTSQTSGNSSSAVSGALTGQTLGQNAFLQILMAQIQHQDPLQPMDDTTFVTQLAQFSSLEQQVTTNQLLQGQASTQQAVQNAQDVALVGKTVTVDGSNVTLGSSGLATPFGFSLGSDAQSVDVTISDSSGNALRTMHLGPESAGVVNSTWDGRDNGGTLQPAGSYSISVTAKDASGNTLFVSQQSTGVVQSLSFGQGAAQLVLSNGVTAPTTSLLSVGQ